MKQISFWEFMDFFQGKNTTMEETWSCDKSVRKYYVDGEHIATLYYDVPTATFLCYVEDDNDSEK